MQIFTIPAAPPAVTALELGVQFTTSRETFDAMDSSALLRQVKGHIKLRKDKDFWSQRPEYQKALGLCCDILKSRGITVALNPEP